MIGTLAKREIRPYLGRMSFLGRFSPFAAIRDLRRFLAARGKHELIFGFLAVAVTATLIIGFVLDSKDLTKPWERDIMYVQDWPLDRSLEQIRAQQKIDMEKRKIEEAKLEKLQRERQAEFKKIDDALTRLGI